MISLCRGDTVIDTLRNVFHANIVKIPESRIQPLVIAAAARNRDRHSTARSYHC